MSKIRVGIVGASPGAGWSSISHIPALKALPDFEITAVATTRRETAEKAAAELSARHAFDNALDLARHPDVDLVSVAVKVPDHHDPTLAAIDAGKHVFCEWPLDRTSEEAQALLTAAEARNVKHAVGLQARMAPAVRHARTLIAEGYVGDILSATVVTGTPAWGGIVDQGHLYILDKATGVTMLAIVGGHTIDALAFVTGGIKNLSATVSNRILKVSVIETNEMLDKTTPDQLAVSGELGCGAPFAFHVRGGRQARSDLLFEIIGTKGELTITSDGNVQMSELLLSGSQGAASRSPIRIEEEEPALASLQGTPAYNVARIYKGLAAAIAGRPSDHPDFGDALRNHQLLDAIERSSASGNRQTIG